MVSNSKYREMLQLKEEKKKKVSKNDWECTYCLRLFSADKRSKKDISWMNCDRCYRKMHVLCVPRDYLVRFGYDSEDEEFNFVCEVCNTN